MFANLTERLRTVVKHASGRGRLTENNIKDSLREVRIALLEADVALPTVKYFIERVREKAMGREVLGSLKPGEEFIRVVRDELTSLLGEHSDELNLRAAPPVVVMLAGLQGAGKTTTAAKLARFLQQTSNKKVLLVSCDIYRPAAIEQLAILAKQINALFHQVTPGQKPVAIALSALEAAKKAGADVLIIDTAGRTHVDPQMMEEAKDIHAAVNPHETLFIVDSMTGQDAVRSAKAFDEALAISGVILTKVDADARGGAALSIRQVTGKPIKFVGAGEHTDALQAFYPERIASSILGMGDVLGLIEQVEQKVDKQKAEQLKNKLLKNKRFDLDDFADQLRQMRNMGGVQGMLDKLPGSEKIAKQAANQLDDKSTLHLEAIILSMTPSERRYPDTIKGSRKRRIASGSGTSVPQVNRLLRQFNQMQKMMKKMRRPGAMAGMMRQLTGRGMPPGMGR